MFKFFTTSDFIHDIERQINRCEFSMQIVINDFEFILLTEKLIQLIENKIDIQLIVISSDEKKSLRIFNLLNRLLNSGVSISWLIDKELIRKADFFAVIDKTLAIYNNKSELEGTDELKVRNLLQIFINLKLDAKEIKLNSGDLDVIFSADTTIINKNEQVNLTWEVQNAQIVSIENLEDNVLHCDKQSVRIMEDTTFILKAKNRLYQLEKKLFIKVIKNEKLVFFVDALDPIINQYVELKLTEKTQRYVGYKHQKIKISWDINSEGMLKEENLGALPLNGSFIFNLKSFKAFNFSFVSESKIQTKNVEIIGIKDSEVTPLFLVSETKKFYRNLSKLWKRS